MVPFTQPARHVWVLAQQEAERLHHHYIGPEHLLLGLLRHDDNPAAGVLRAHGLDLETVRGEVGRLIARGVLPLDQQVSAYLGLPDHAHHPVRLLVEARGLTLEVLRAAVRSELDRDQ
jgi:ATP-dependent Clp protease ATP-binding subunit ClpA